MNWLECTNRMDRFVIKTHTGGKIVPSVICIEHPAGAPGHQVSSAKYHMHGAVIKIRSIIPSNSALVNSSHESAS